MTPSPENRRSPYRNHACDGEPPLGAAGGGTTWPRRHGGGAGRGPARCRGAQAERLLERVPASSIVEGDIDRVFSLHRSLCRSVSMAQQDAQNGGSKNAAAAATVVFGAEEVGRMLNPKHKAKHELPLILSAELKIAGSTILVTDLVDDTSSPRTFYASKPEEQRNLR
ncbi:hypothetical protein JHK87_003479 [Glycine soja]|nr:hypothetical protein JHK87_003479 [Glycine soja]